MNKPTFFGPPAPSMREMLARNGIIPAHPRDAERRELERIAAARKAAESAICIAMVTSAIPGIEVTYLDGEAGLV